MTHVGLAEAITDLDSLDYSYLSKTCYDVCSTALFPRNSQKIYKKKKDLYIKKKQKDKSKNKSGKANSKRDKDGDKNFIVLLQPSKFKCTWFETSPSEKFDPNGHHFIRELTKEQFLIMKNIALNTFWNMTKSVILAAMAKNSIMFPRNHMLTECEICKSPIIKQFVYFPEMFCTCVHSAVSVDLDLDNEKIAFCAPTLLVKALLAGEFDYVMPVNERQNLILKKNGKASPCNSTDADKRHDKVSEIGQIEKIFLEAESEINELMPEDDCSEFYNTLALLDQEKYEMDLKNAIEADEKLLNECEEKHDHDNGNVVPEVSPIDLDKLDMKLTNLGVEPKIDEHPCSSEILEEDTKIQNLSEMMMETTTVIQDNTIPSPYISDEHTGSGRNNLEELLGIYKDVKLKIFAEISGNKTIPKTLKDEVITMLEIEKTLRAQNSASYKLKDDSLPSKTTLEKQNQ
jgi:hypothetical protein